MVGTRGIDVIKKEDATRSRIWCWQVVGGTGTGTGTT